MDTYSNQRLADFEQVQRSQTRLERYGVVPLSLPLASIAVSIHLQHMVARRLWKCLTGLTDKLPVAAPDLPTSIY